MKYFFRFLILFAFALIGGLLFSITVNILIMINAVPQENISAAFGYEMTNRAVIVWIVSVFIGILSIFMESKWRIALLFLPLLLPSLYAAIYTLSLD